MRTQDKKEKELEIEMIRLSFHQSSARHDHFRKGAHLQRAVFLHLTVFNFYTTRKANKQTFIRALSQGHLRGPRPLCFFLCEKSKRCTQE